MQTKVLKIRKRDGRIVDFDQSKIAEAVLKAAKSVGGKDKRMAKQLSDKVVEHLESLGKEIPTVEEIQDAVEKVLIEEGHASTAKSFILYRQQRAEIRREKQLVLEKEEIDEVDKKFDVNALKVLKARYLRRDSTGKLIEMPTELFTRVAVHAALPDLFYDSRVFDIEAKQPVNMIEDFKPALNGNKYGIGKYKLNVYHLEALKRMYDRFNKNKQIKVTWSKFFEMIKRGEFNSYEINIDEFYILMTNKLFMPNTPAIANFGNPLGMGSACFHPNQPIITNEGPREIKDIKVGDTVLTHKGRFRRVQEILVRFTKSLLQVNCENLPKPTMLLTEEHPVLSFKNNNLQWMPISKLEEGDKIALSYPKTVADSIKVNENCSDTNTILLNDNLSDIDFKTVKFSNINKISKIDYIGPVYNLEVEEDHSYVANMVSVHNCFVLDVPDSIDGIMETLKNTAIVFKAGGGMGYNFSKLRPEGDFVSSTGGVASGPMSFMRLFDTMTEVIKQGGIRRGANMGILNSNHPDIEKFITAKAGNQALRNFNISILIMPDFWEHYEKNEPYPLLNPRNGEVVKYVNPRELFDKVVYQAWESAEPGVIFFDRVNEFNPFFEYLGPIVTTNPCGEVLLYPNEPCNLGSINVWAFVRQDEESKSYLDWDALKEAVMSCTRFLDNVIDVNNFPLKAIEEMSLSTRKIGLGLMGVADLMYELRLPYNSEEGREFMEQLMEFVNYWSKVESVELAKKRGNLPYYDKSFFKQGKLPFSGSKSREKCHFDWDKVSEAIKRYGIRNGYTTIIAPTGSISMIAGCSSGIEPVYSLVFEKNVKVGSFFYVDPAAEKVLREEGLYNDKLMEDINEHKGSVQGIDYVPEEVKRVLVTAMDITPEEHIRALASFQKWVDSSISKTNNFPADATVEMMRESYILAYQLGCKDVTVFRDSSIKDQVLVAPKAKEKKDEIKIEIKPEMKKIIKESESGLVFANGNGANEPTGKMMTNCPECGAALEKKEGCVECPNCGWGLCM